MILRATLSISILLLTLGPAPAHVPAGTVRGIWQWPLEALPVMDGDLSEWEVVPDSLWLDLNTLDADGNPLFWARDWEARSAEKGQYGTEADPADLTMRFAVGWNDETDRLYFAQHRHDDLYDRDSAELPVSAAGTTASRSNSMPITAVDPSGTRYILEKADTRPRLLSSSSRPPVWIAALFSIGTGCG